MQQISLFLLFLLSSQASFAQAPQELTAERLATIKAEVEKMVPAFQKSLAKKDLTADQIEFALDTFRIERIVAKRMDIDYSTVGMNETVNEMAASYDKLMNKYYNKLLKSLTPDDKKTLITAQKAWLAYRDAETKLIWAMTKEEYSGGGTMQSNIGTAASADLVVKRTIEIFNYYDNLIKEK